MYRLVDQAMMDEIEVDDRLNPTDREILELLSEGRETTGSMADRLDKHPQTIRDRLKWLQEWGYVERYHENTGLYEIAKQETND